VGGGYVWAATDDSVWKVSLDGSPLTKISFRAGVGNIAYGTDALWVSSGGTVVRMDPHTNAIRRYEVGHMLPGIGTSGDTVLVSVSPTGGDLLTNLGDKVLQIRLSQDWLDDLDPAVAGAPGTNEWPWLQQVLFATSARLLNYRDAPAPAGWRLVPEVAASLPTVSRDSRTYMFRIRPGFRFSPPSNGPVTAGTFKYSIERALSPKLGQNAPAVAVASDIAGVRAFRAGGARHIAGIKARGSTLAITLVRPAPDFPERIALPYFSAVPIGTPIVANGLRDPIASAGPYYVGGNDGGGTAVVRRNPNYPGGRPRQLDSVVVSRNDIVLGDAVAAVATGKADYIAEPGPQLAPETPLARRYRRTSVGAARRYFRVPMLATDELVFNTRHGVLVNSRLRRAVSLALDRIALAASFDDLATDRILPPGIPGFLDEHVYPRRAALRDARGLVGKQGRHAVLAVCGEPACLAVARIVAADLARIGVQIATKQYAGSIGAIGQRRGADIVLARAYAPYPDPVATLRAALGRAFRRQLDHVARLDRAHRLVAAERLELRLLKGQAPVAPFGNPTIPEFFSARVGCKTFQPLFFGVDLASLCLQQDLTVPKAG
jgi:ABC-type transport system substrate-binding protein